MTVEALQIEWANLAGGQKSIEKVVGEVLRRAPKAEARVERETDRLQRMFDEGALDLYEEEFNQELNELWKSTFFDLGCSIARGKGITCLGAGTGRIVFGLSEGLVLKVALDEGGQNGNEVNLWREAGPLTKSMLAPVVAAGPGARPTWLVMANCGDVELRDYPGDENISTTEENMAEIFDPLVPFEDALGDSLGEYEGRVCLRDYGRLISDRLWQVDSSVLAMIEENAARFEDSALPVWRSQVRAKSL